VPNAEHDAALDRDALREQTRRWTATQRLLLVERVVEHMPEADLERLLVGLVRLDQVRTGDLDHPTSPADRVAAHAAATQRGDFLGDLIIRNKHGQREPWQTHAWVAATSHLFDLALEHRTEDALRDLVALVEEVDERCDRLVVFEDSCADENLGRQVEAARGIIGGP
jgi:hypothetical protein